MEMCGRNSQLTDLLFIFLHILALQGDLGGRLGLGANLLQTDHQAANELFLAPLLGLELLDLTLLSPHVQARLQAFQSGEGLLVFLFEIIHVDLRNFAGIDFALEILEQFFVFFLVGKKEGTKTGRKIFLVKIKIKNEVKDEK